MREENPERRMLYKLLFLLVVTLFISIVYIWKWMADDPKEQDPEEMFQKIEQQEEIKKPGGLDKKKINALLGDGNKKAKTQKEEAKELMQNNLDEGDLEQNYMNTYSEKEVKQAKEQAKTVLALYILQVTDWSKWNGAVTSSYLEKAKKDMTKFKDEITKRELGAIELFASQPSKNGEITYGAFATWHVTVKGKSTSKPLQLYYIALQKEGENWIVSDIITPNNLNMEGERKGEK